MSFKIIYQDDHLLVLDKPPGLVVDPAESVKKVSLADILIKDFNIALPRGGIVHRLDKDTSGILLAAKTQEALEGLQNQFKQRQVKKEYLALVHGWVQGAGVVDAAIIRNPSNREKFIAIPPGRSQIPSSRWPASPKLQRGEPNGLLEEGRDAVTEYIPINNFQFSILNLNHESGKATLQSIFNDLNNIQMRKLERMHYNQFTLLKCQPKTGRTHQIRVHLKYINHPVVSDEKYGGRKVCRLDKRWCPRIFLHAAKIGFKHPKSGEWMELESQLPEDLVLALSQLTTYYG